MTLLGLWLVPVIISLYFHLWRFVEVWVLFSGVTGYVLYTCISKRIDRATPRRVSIHGCRLPPYLSPPSRQCMGRQCWRACDCQQPLLSMLVHCGRLGTAQRPGRLRPLELHHLADCQEPILKDRHQCVRSWGPCTVSFASISL